MPRLVRFLGFHCAMGVWVGVAFAAVLVATNVGGLRDLLEASEQPFVPMAMLFIGSALTFGSATMGAAVMSIEDEDD